MIVLGLSAMVIVASTLFALIVLVGIDVERQSAAHHHF